MGFDKDTLKERGCTVQLYDLGGGRTIRSIWKNFTAESHGFIFLVDASNQERLEEAKTVLTDTFDTGFLSGKPILFVANKQDLDSAVGVDRIRSVLELDSLQNVSLQVIPCSAVLRNPERTDPRARQGLKWLMGEIVRDFGRISSKVQTDTAEMEEQRRRERQEREERIRKRREEEERAAAAAAESEPLPAAGASAEASARQPAERTPSSSPPCLPGGEAQVPSPSRRFSPALARLPGTEGTGGPVACARGGPAAAERVDRPRLPSGW
eukprot:CAMPEP_0177620184 /NCGR_PEP_ID=MMETSP0419_2-20121207/26736_1 /TAXON_ID=582737 /ORGANISM="Tetraselmis sp., Strain GSL018" /LENGTH=267 /DNA_ID=CAMNT_0019119657 /DNA_START=564 /DNA_END=1364 /DNA_ORIENTATION=+